MDHSDYMALANQSAREGIEAGHGGPFGACIVQGTNVIAVAHNTVLHSQDPTAHAEVNAIRMAAKHCGSHVLSGCTLYTTCSPCPMCLAATYWARIDIIYAGVKNEVASEFGFDDSLIFKEINNSPEMRRVVIQTGFCEQDVRDTFQRWHDLNGTLY